MVTAGATPLPPLAVPLRILARAWQANAIIKGLSFEPQQPQLPRLRAVLPRASAFVVLVDESAVRQELAQPRPWDVPTQVIGHAQDVGLAQARSLAPPPPPEALIHTFVTPPHAKQHSLHAVRPAPVFDMCSA